MHAPAVRLRTTAGALALVLLLPGTAAAQRDRTEAGTRIDTTFAFARTGSVEIAMPSGNITVTGWDRDEVRVAGTSERGDLRLDASATRLSLDARAVRGRLGDTHAEVMVPRGARVTMRSYAGNLIARGIHGRVVADASSGRIEVSELGGGVELTTTAGDVRGRGIAGPVHANTTSGNVELEDVAGDIHAATTAGSVRLVGIRARAVNAGALNGNVEFAGSLQSDGRYVFNAHSGNVLLTVPDGASATFRLGTFNGHVESEMPLTLREGQLGRGGEVVFSLGGGEASVAVQTHSGNIIIKRAPRRNPQ